MSYRVLIVDDDESMRFFLTEAMEKRGYEVSAAGSAGDAFAELKRAEYDLTLMDICLPGMNGIDAIGKVRTSNPHAIIIVMARPMSGGQAPAPASGGHDSRDFAIDAVRAGAYDYFSKPIKVDELGIVIERALERRRLQREIDEPGKCGAGFQPANAINQQPGKAAPHCGLCSISCDGRRVQPSRGPAERRDPQDAEALSETAGHLPHARRHGAG